MTLTKKPNKNGYFIKVCNAFGVRLDGGCLTKKYGIQGRDHKGLFYCDCFPTNYVGKNPTLKVWRITDKPFTFCGNKASEKWECQKEKNDTTRQIWSLFLTSGCNMPQALKDQNTKRNNQITHNLCYGKHQTIWTGGVTDVCDFREENKTMLYKAKKLKYKYIVQVIGKSTNAFTTSDTLYKVGAIVECDGEKVRIIERKQVGGLCLIQQK